MLVAAEFRADFGFDGELFAELAFECGTEVFTGFDLATGELPFEFVASAATALAYENFSVLFDDCGDDDHKGTLEVYLSRMYSPELLDHFQNPRNVGELAPPAITVEVTNPACGDVMRLSAQFDGHGSVVAVAYKVKGCTASIAAGSVLTELMKGRPISGLSALPVEEALGGLEPASKHALVLCRDAVQRLVRAYGR